MKNIMYKVSIEGNSNPYRKNTFKHILFAWALDRETFTREEFLAAVLELKQEHEVTSKMNDVVLPKAWWNEFANKHEVFVSAE